jgi:hypothetical protein
LNSLTLSRFVATRQQFGQLGDSAQDEVEHTIPPVPEILKELGCKPYWLVVRLVRTQNFAGRELEPVWQTMVSSTIVGAPPGVVLTGFAEVHSPSWRVDGKNQGFYS